MRFKVWFGVMAVTMGAAIAHAASYRSMTVRDFAIEGPRLARMAGRQGNPNAVEITGAYARAGALEELFENGTQLVMAEQGLSDPPTVPLLTDYASPKLRGALVDCRSSGAPSCLITVRGYVVSCTITHAYGSQTVPCLSVMDGEGYVPPPPSPEQIAAMQAAAEAAQRQHAAELVAEVNDWEEHVETCLSNWQQREASNSTPPMVAYSQFITRLANPAQAQRVATEQKADRARQLYTLCASRRWPDGAHIPDRMPDQIQAVIDQCMQAGRTWRDCTENNPPRP